jgi:hypothetical protein
MLTLTAAEYAALRALLAGVTHAEAGAAQGISKRTSEIHDAVTVRFLSL